jgi:DNA polymerase-1
LDGLNILYLDNKNLNNTYILDIEADGLNPSRIWCCVILNKGTRQIWKFFEDGSKNISHDLRKFFNEHKNAIYIGHNIIPYDGYHLGRLCHFEWNYDRTIDTLVLSYLYSPKLVGGHSLEAYGSRLKFPKGNFSDWSKFSPEMLNYCENDVLLTEKIYDALVDRMNKIGFSELSCWIEHKTRELISEQERNGCWFNIEGGQALLSDLRLRESTLAEQIYKLFPPELEEVGRYTRRYKKDGSDYASFERHLRNYPAIRENEDGTYSTLDYHNFNIGSPKQRLERLLKLGFEPKSLTKKGNPKVDEDALVTFAEASGRPEIRAISDWMVVHSRATLLAGNPETGSTGWLEYALPDHRIHGKVFSCGAASRRMIHHSPQTGNIPSSHKAAYGKECRALWSVEPNSDLVMVGTDASGLENVGLLHFLNNPEATEILNRPKPNDIHTANSRLLTKLLNREIDREWGAKTSWYAFIYGAQKTKLAEIVKGKPREGQKVIDTFFTNVPGLKDLIYNVQEEWEENNGLLICPDGGFVRCPSPHSALNYKIQPLGAIVMKLADIRRQELARQKGIWYRKVLTIHDEWQDEANKNDAKELSNLSIKAISQAAEELNFRVPLTGESKIGNNWSETH